MCSSMLLVVQSTIVTASIVRGSAPRPITISLLLTRSWASAGAARATTTRTTVTARKTERIRPPLNAKLRIERVAEPVAEQVHAKRRQCQRRARKGGQPPRDVEEVAALGQHRAPRGRGRLNTEAQERDGGFRHDELRELQAGHDDDRRRDVGEHVTEEQTRAAHAQRGRRLDEVALLHRQHLPANHASIHDPSSRRKAEDDVAEAETDDRIDRHGQEDERKRELHVGQAHERRRRPALDEAGDQAEQAAADGGDDDRARADEQREPRAVEDAGEQVATELIGAQRVARRARGPQALSEVARQRIDRRQPRRGGGGHDGGERDADAEPGFHARNLTRGSSQPKRMSTRRLITVYVAEITKT